MGGKENATKEETKLLETTKCSFCLKTVEHSLIPCAKRHKICDSCRINLTECPICKSKYVLEKSVQSNQIIEPLPKMCKHKINGCVSSDLDDHQQFCTYRTTPCRVDNKCTWQGQITQLVNHLNTVHNKNCIQTPTQLTLYSHNFNVFCHPFSFKVWTPVYVYENFFWKYTEVDEKYKRLLIKLYHLPQGKPKHVFYGVQIFTSGSFSFSHSMKASTEDIKNEITYPDQSCMMVPFEELYRFYEKSGELSYSFMVMREDIKKLF